MNFDNDPTIRRIRDGLSSAASRVQTEQDFIAIMEENRYLREENERLKRIVNLVDLVKERDELKARLDALEANR